jgi:hypothetical protein
MAAPSEPKPKTVQLIDYAHPEPIECRVTLNPEGDRVVFVMGDYCVGFSYDTAMGIAGQFADCLEIMREERKQNPPPGTIQ